MTLPQTDPGVEVSVGEGMALVRETRDHVVRADMNRGLSMNPTLAGLLTRFLHSKGCNPCWDRTTDRGVTKTLIFIGASRDIVVEAMQYLGRASATV